MSAAPPLAAADLRARAEGVAAGLPALLAEAEHLAGTVLLGEHGRRRSGLGDDFWQYRPVRPGDEARLIDWRRSGKGDDQFVREREWQVAQSVLIWIDRAASMRFASDKSVPQKLDRARLIALACAILLLRGGERVGLNGTDMPPRRGEAQILRLADAFLSGSEADYGAPDLSGLMPHARAVMVSDFLGDIGPVEAALAKAADRDVRGVLLMVLDPSEEAFPFEGRTIFESVGGTLAYETLKAGALRDRYIDRLAARKDRLRDLARAADWQFTVHHTDTPVQAILLWLYTALEGRG